MLRLFTGRAGTGKTAAVINEIHTAVLEKQGRRLLIVPEQYSHEAERELCRVCGDSMSLYAEVMSFTGLARRIASQQGGGAAPYLDKGGRLLCMALALDGAASRLRVYGSAGRRAETQSALLAAVDSLKAAGVDSEALYAASENCPGGLGDKLADMALILEAYDAVVANGHADPADRLTVLAEQILDSSMGPDDHIYVDGFIDFTFQERQVLRALAVAGVIGNIVKTNASISGAECGGPPQRARAARLCGGTWRGDGDAAFRVGNLRRRARFLRREYVQLLLRELSGRAERFGEAHDGGRHGGRM